MTALGHGIKGKNSVTVSGGTVTVTSGKDGITSDETENEEKGFVTIEDGEIIITSAGDGVSAETTLTVTGGVIPSSAAVEAQTRSRKPTTCAAGGTSTIPPVTITAQAARA